METGGGRKALCPGDPIAAAQSTRQPDHVMDRHCPQDSNHKSSQKQAAEPFQAAQGVLLAFARLSATKEDASSGLRMCVRR